jgi:alkanesulfonate monooxygenase SsuD/methylene tetrahydromethanopterin reductase-like flavin-dependent oxidoreductase (luciferase family)
VAAAGVAGADQWEGDAVKVFVFDLLPYPENLDHLKVGKELPWPLPGRHFDPEVGARAYAEHLEAWEELDRLGYDGVGFNEHHTSPYGLMNSPNLMAAAASQRTRRLKLLIYGNALPIHDPLRLAEELAMLDCMSGGRIIAGFVRGIPREYRVYGVPMPESRARFVEAFEIVRGLWTEEVFTYRGRFWSYEDVAIWPRPVQRPHPPVWIPVTTSKETIEWAAEHDLPITPGLVGGGLREDIVRYYARCLARHGRRITPGHLILSVDAYVADSKEQAVREAGPHLLYFSRTLFSHGNITEANLQRDAGYLSPAALDYVRPENLPAAMRAREEYRDMTMEQVARLAEGRPWGSPEEVRDRIIAEADAVGADTVLVHLNRGDMPHEMFLAQIRRFAAEVLPALQAHEVRTVPVAADLTPGRV